MLPRDRGGGYLAGVRRILSLALAAALPVWAARADAPLPLGVADLMGARPLSVSAYRGIAPGNDGIFLNPAGLSARRRFATELQYLYDGNAGATGGQWFGVSMVDSETSAVAGGVAATRFASGPWLGWATHLAVATPVSPGLYLGATAKYLSLGGPGGSTVRATTADAGLYWEASSLVSLGLAGYNLIPAGHRQIMPRALGAGLSIGTDRFMHVALDWRADFDRRASTTHLLAVGAEVLVLDTVPVRAGFVKDDTLGGKWWSVGTGLVSASGVALDVGYRRSVESPADWAVAAALKVFFLSGQ